MDPPGHRIAEQQAGQRRRHTDGQQSPGQAIDNAAIGAIRFADLSRVVLQQTRAGRLHILAQLLSQFPVVVRPRLGWLTQAFAPLVPIAVPTLNHLMNVRFFLVRVGVAANLL